MLVSYGQFIKAGDKRYVVIRRGIVDLILRASEHEPSYCVPVSYLNKSGRDHHGVSGSNETPLMDGQLIMASRFEAESELGGERALMVHLFIYNRCLHINRTVGIIDKIRRNFARPIPSMTVRSEKSEVFKCSFCVDGPANTCEEEQQGLYTNCSECLGKLRTKTQKHAVE